jgi:hypothetical protein
METLASCPQCLTGKPLTLIGEGLFCVAPSRLKPHHDSSLDLGSVGRLGLEDLETFPLIPCPKKRARLEIEINNNPHDLTGAHRVSLGDDLAKEPLADAETSSRRNARRAKESSRLDDDLFFHA